MSVNTYTGLHALRYDVVYADKPYADEARFVDSLIRDLGIGSGRLLDVACGTGRHAYEFSSLGWNVTGVDLSGALLEQARVNVPAARFLRHDMRELDLEGDRFEALTCLFDSIGYALDDAGVLATLEAFRRHLAVGGAAVIEFLHAPAVLHDASPLRVRRFDLSDAGDELLRISRTGLDQRRSIMAVEFELIELRADGTYERWVESQSNRFFSVSEMRDLLDRADLRAVEFIPAYQDGQAIDDETFHVLAVARAE